MNTLSESRNRSTQTANRGDGRNRSERGFVIPPANISATDNEYILELEMPGVTKEGLEVLVEGNELTIIGRRKLDLPESDLCYCESPQADFRRVFEVGPDVDTGKISAE